LKTCVAITRRKKREKIMSKKLFLLLWVAYVVSWGSAGGFYELWRDAQDQLALAESSGKNQEAQIAELRHELSASKEFERHRAEVLRYAIIDRDNSFAGNDDYELATWAYLVSLAEPLPDASRLKETADGVPWIVRFQGEYDASYSIVVAVESSPRGFLKPCFVLYGENQPGNLFRMEGISRDGAVEFATDDEWKLAGPEVSENSILATNRDLFRFCQDSF